jgi:hypothetical protein
MPANGAPEGANINELQSRTRAGKLTIWPKTARGSHGGGAGNMYPTIDPTGDVARTDTFGYIEALYDARRPTIRAR